MANINKEDNSSVRINFSIDHILNCAGQSTCKSNRYDEIQSNEEVMEFRPFEMEVDNIFHHYRPTFQWLNCNRYYPPKLPRRPKREGLKRQAGAHPRIPFSSMQIEILESSFKKSHYLCPMEIEHLTKELKLTDTRIKIWFQNRRAREKREKDTINEKKTQSE